MKMSERAPRKAPEKAPLSRETLQHVLKQLVKGTLPTLPKELEVLVEAYRASQVSDEWWDEECEEHQVVLVAQAIAAVWTTQVRLPLIQEGAVPREWLKALAPVAGYLEPVIEGYPQRWRREDAIRCLFDQAWLIKWIDHKETVEAVVAFEQEQYQGSKVPKRTYDHWRRYGLYYLLDGIERALGEKRAGTMDPVSAFVLPIEALGVAWDSGARIMEKHWERRLETVRVAMKRSWRGSGWLQGAKIVGPLVRRLAGRPPARQVREEAEEALLNLLPPVKGPWNAQHWLAQAVGEALLALAPLSEGTLKRLWYEVYGPGGEGWGRQELQLLLAAEPGIARRLLENPGTLKERYGPQWLWHVARSPGIDMELLIGTAERFYGGEDDERWLMRLHAVVGALSTLGTEQAAFRMGEWLVRETNRTGAQRWVDKKRGLVVDGLSHWRGDSRSVWGGLEVVMRPGVPRWVWQGYLQGALKAGRADAAAHLAALAEADGMRWTKEQWTEVVKRLGEYGDERVAPYLARWWDRERERLKPGERGVVIWIGEALWGAEGDRGVLVQRPTDWLVEWLEDAEVSDDFREMVAYWVLRPRYPDEKVIRLGQRWLEQGARAGRPAIMRAGAYLTNAADEHTLKALQEAEMDRQPRVGSYLKGRMGRWEEVLEVLQEQLSENSLAAWDLVELIGTERYQPALPALIEYYLDGEEWIADAGLHRFDWKEIDACLEALWEARGMTVNHRVAMLLWRLGTPGAMRQVLEAMKQGMRRPYGTFPRHYREAVWPLLAEFVEEEFVEENENENEFRRWEIFGVIQYLWPPGEAWPWEVAAFFFRRLDDRDQHVKQQAQRVLEAQIGQVEIQAWCGRERVYRDGLRQIALEGTKTQRQMALRWLAWMRAGIARSALERWELERLLAAESGAPWPEVLAYVAGQQRRDLLDKVRAAAAKVSQNAELLKPQVVREGRESNALQERREELKSLQGSLVTALAMLEEDGEKLVQMARGEGVISTRGWVNVQVQALGALISRRQYLKTLVTAVQRGEAPEWWLMAALAAQGILLEEADGEMVVRQGEKTFPLTEWARE